MATAEPPKQRSSVSLVTLRASATALELVPRVFEHTPLASPDGGLPDGAKSVYSSTHAHTGIDPAASYSGLSLSTSSSASSSTLQESKLGDGDQKSSTSIGPRAAEASDTGVAEDAEERADGDIAVMFHNGTVFEGSVRHGLREGSGALAFPDGLTHTGMYAHNLPCGEGTLTLPDGSVYRGEFVDGRRHGQGEFRLGGSEAVYTGGFVDGARSGKGILTYDADSKRFYRGDWENDRRHGFGTMQYASGNAYHGEWHADRKQGIGLMDWPTRNEEYIGEWYDDAQEGDGCHTWHANGVVLARYLGGFSRGKRNGVGTFYYTNGSRLTGTWQDDLKHGMGVYVASTGAVYGAAFEHDRPTRTSTSTVPTKTTVGASAAQLGATAILAGIMRAQPSMETETFASIISSKPGFCLRLADCLPELASMVAATPSASALRLLPPGTSAEAALAKSTNLAAEAQNQRSQLLDRLSASAVSNVNSVLMRWNSRLRGWYATYAGMAPAPAWHSNASASPKEERCSADALLHSYVKMLFQADIGGEDGPRLHLHQLHRFLHDCALLFGPQLTLCGVADILFSIRVREVEAVIQACAQLPGTSRSHENGTAFEEDKKDDGQNAHNNESVRQMVLDELRRLSVLHVRRYDPMLPVLYREFVEVLVRVAHARYAYFGVPAPEDLLLPAPSVQTSTGIGGALSPGAPAGEGNPPASPRFTGSQLPSLESNGDAPVILSSSAGADPEVGVTPRSLGGGERPERVVSRGSRSERVRGARPFSGAGASTTSMAAASTAVQVNSVTALSAAPKRTLVRGGAEELAYVLECMLFHHVQPHALEPPLSAAPLAAMAAVPSGRRTPSSTRRGPPVAAASVGALPVPQPWTSVKEDCIRSAVLAAGTTAGTDAASLSSEPLQTAVHDFVRERLPSIQFSMPLRPAAVDHCTIGEFLAQVRVWTPMSGGDDASTSLSAPSPSTATPSLLGALAPIAGADELLDLLAWPHNAITARAGDFVPDDVHSAAQLLTAADLVASLRNHGLIETRPGPVAAIALPDAPEGSARTSSGSVAGPASSPRDPRESSKSTAGKSGAPKTGSAKAGGKGGAQNADEAAAAEAAAIALYQGFAESSRTLHTFASACDTMLLSAPVFDVVTAVNAIFVALTPSPAVKSTVSAHAGLGVRPTTVSAPPVAENVSKSSIGGEDDAITAASSTELARASIATPQPQSSSNTPPTSVPASPRAAQTVTEKGAHGSVAAPGRADSLMSPPRPSTSASVAASFATPAAWRPYTAAAACRSKAAVEESVTCITGGREAVPIPLDDAVEMKLSRVEAAEAVFRLCAAYGLTRSRRAVWINAVWPRVNVAYEAAKAAAKTEAEAWHATQVALHAVSTLEPDVGAASAGRGRASGASAKRAPEKAVASAGPAAAKKGSRATDTAASSEAEPEEPEPVRLARAELERQLGLMLQRAQRGISVVASFDTAAEQRYPSAAELDAEVAKAAGLASEDEVRALMLGGHPGATVLQVRAQRPESRRIQTPHTLKHFAAMGLLNPPGVESAVDAANAVLQVGAGAVTNADEAPAASPAELLHDAVLDGARFVLPGFLGASR